MLNTWVIALAPHARPSKSFPILLGFEKQRQNRPDKRPVQRQSLTPKSSHSVMSNPVITSSTRPTDEPLRVPLSTAFKSSAHPPSPTSVNRISSPPSELSSRTSETTSTVEVPCDPISPQTISTSPETIFVNRTQSVDQGSLPDSLPGNSSDLIASASHGKNFESTQSLPSPTMTYVLPSAYEHQIGSGTDGRGEEGDEYHNQPELEAVEVDAAASNTKGKRARSSFRPLVPGFALDFSKQPRSSPSPEAVFSTLPPPKRRATGKSTSNPFRLPDFLPVPSKQLIADQFANISSHTSTSPFLPARQPSPSRPPPLDPSFTSKATGTTATLASGRKITLWAPPPLPTNAYTEKSASSEPKFKIVNPRRQSISHTVPTSPSPPLAPPSIDTQAGPVGRASGALTSRTVASRAARAERYAQLEPMDPDAGAKDFW